MNKKELAQYKYHPEIGATILGKHANMENIARVVMQHHERLDGSGFPYHLKGGEISKAAQIIGIVDTYHNMVYKRPISDCVTSKYNHTTYSINKHLENTESRHISAINYLISKSKTLFDRSLVDIFISIAELDRKAINGQSIRKVHIHEIDEDMVIAKDYHTSFGLLIAGKGDTVTKAMKRAVKRFTENGELPYKILVYNNSLMNK